MSFDAISTVAVGSLLLLLVVLLLFLMLCLLIDCADIVSTLLFSFATVVFFVFSLVSNMSRMGVGKGIISVSMI